MKNNCTTWFVIGILITGCRTPPRRFHETPQKAVSADPGILSLSGCHIVANDGQFLGMITPNEFAPDSILNEFGDYGSEFSSTSIFNEFGDYGGEFSKLSPFNEFTPTPPQVISEAGDKPKATPSAFPIPR